MKIQWIIYLVIYTFRQCRCGLYILSFCVLAQAWEFKLNIIQHTLLWQTLLLQFLTFIFLIDYIINEIMMTDMDYYCFTSYDLFILHSFKFQYISACSVNELHFQARGEKSWRYQENISQDSRRLNIKHQGVKCWQKYYGPYCILVY